MTVYIVQLGYRPVVKIGITRDIWARLKTLQDANPEILRVRAVLDGDAEREAQLHLRFMQHWIRGEWFRLEGSLKQYIESLQRPAMRWREDKSRDRMALRKRVLAYRQNRSPIIEVWMIEEGAKQHMIALAEAYALATGLAEATISRLAHGNCNFFQYYRAGKCTTTLRKYDEMLEFFKARWPRGVPRPRTPSIRWSGFASRKHKQIAGERRAVA